MLNYFAIGKWVAIALLIGGLLLTVKIQTVRVASLKVELATSKQETQNVQALLDKAIADNQVNVLTIASLKGDILRLNNTCDKRLKIKDDLIAEIRISCPKGDANVAPITGNALLDKLNRMQ